MTTRTARLQAAWRLQTSMNLALGSALASIGLTAPVVVPASNLLDIPLERLWRCHRGARR